MANSDLESLLNGKNAFLEGLKLHLLPGEPTKSKGRSALTWCQDSESSLVLFVKAEAEFTFSAHDRLKAKIFGEKLTSIITLTQLRNLITLVANLSLKTEQSHISAEFQDSVLFYNQNEDSQLLISELDAEMQ